MNNIKKEPYEVLNEEKVKEKLGIRSRVQGINISKINNECFAVFPIPPTRNPRGISVSKDLLKELHDDECIKRKNE